MRNWKTRLIALGMALITGLGIHMPLQAYADAGPQQVAFSSTPETITTSSNVELKLEYQSIQLTAADLQGKEIDAELYDKADMNSPNFDTTYGAYTEFFNKFSDPSSYVVGGKILATVVSGTPIEGDTYMPADYDVTSKFVLADSCTNVKWDSVSGCTMYFSVTQSSYAPYTGMWFILDYNNNKYLINIPVEIQAKDFLVPDTQGNLMTIYSGSQGLLVNNNGIATANFDESSSTYAINLSKYDNTWSSASTIAPSFGYGAVGVGATDVNLGGVTKSVFQTSVPLAQEDYSFVVKNGAGEEKTYTVKVNMPWYILNNLDADYNPTVQIDGSTLTLSSGKFENIQAGKEVVMSFTLDAGKKIESVDIRETTSTTSTKKVDYEIRGNSIVFTMPRNTVAVHSITTADKDMTEYSISTSVGLAEGTEETSGIVTVQNNQGESISGAIEGDLVTIKAGISTNHVSLYDYEFDHWEADSSLISEEDKEKPEITFTMPAENVAIKAVYVHKGVSITIGTNNSQGGAVEIGAGIGKTVSTASQVEHLYKTGATYTIYINDINVLGYEFLGWSKTGQVTDLWENGVVEGVSFSEHMAGYTIPKIELSEDMQELTFIAMFRARTAGIITLETNDSVMGTVSASTSEGSIVSGETLLFDGMEVSLKAEPKNGYLFQKWEIVNPVSDSGVIFEDATAAETLFTMPAQTALTIRAVFAEDPDFKSDDCEMTMVELLKADDTLVKVANQAGSKFTIKLGSTDMTTEEAGKLAMGGYKLRITTSNGATVEMEGGFKDDNTATWAQGVSNPISKGGEESFIVTAENGTSKNTYTIAITYDDRPYLNAGKVERISDKEAKVTFTSTSTGMYYYAVVDAGAGEPEISTDSVGIQIKVADRENTISLGSLTAGAKDIYIVVKNDDDASNVKISDVLKVTIPEYDENAVTYEIATVQTPGGKISVDKTEAKEGETVKVTVTPDSGKQMIAGTLKFSWDQAPYTVQSIDESTMTFTMPASGGSVSCRFEDAETNSGSSTTTKSTISAFQINGVSATVNDTTGTISIVLPYNTDLTSLTPVIVLGDGVKSISPASSKTVDLSKPVTYTVTMEDGTTKTYAVTAYTEAAPKSEQLWENMLEQIGGSTSGKTWWQKAKEFKTNGKYPIYW